MTYYFDHLRSEPVIGKDDIFCTEQKWGKEFTLKVIQTLDMTNQINMLFIYVNYTYRFSLC